MAAVAALRRCGPLLGPGSGRIVVSVGGHLRVISCCLLSSRRARVFPPSDRRACPGSSHHPPGSARFQVCGAVPDDPLPRRVPNPGLPGGLPSPAEAGLTASRPERSGARRELLGASPPPLLPTGPLTRQDNAETGWPVNTFCQENAIRCASTICASVDNQRLRVTVSVIPETCSNDLRDFDPLHLYIRLFSGVHRGNPLPGRNGANGWRFLQFGACCDKVSRNDVNR